MFRYVIIAILITFLVFHAGFHVGHFIGKMEKTLQQKFTELFKTIEEKKPEIGVTPASYGPVKGYVAGDSDIGLVETKTPEQLEWQEQERLREMQLGR